MLSQCCYELDDFDIPARRAWGSSKLKLVWDPFPCVGAVVPRNSNFLESRPQRVPKAGNALKIETKSSFGGNYLGWRRSISDFSKISTHQSRLPVTPAPFLLPSDDIFWLRQPSLLFATEGASSLRLPGCSRAPRPVDCSPCLVCITGHRAACPNKSWNIASCFSLTHKCVPHVRARACAEVCN